MEVLELLCNCCKCKQCLKDKVIIKQEKNCKTIKCLQFIKDDTKIAKPEQFIYIVKSDISRR